MFQIFNINVVNQFIISSFITDKPININTLDGKFLSCCEKNNVVDFYITDDNSGRQKWIIEKDDVEENVFYIKCAFKRYNSTQYLGCPNQNNRVFLYTSKNKYTKWCITREKDDIYQIQYVGEKFDVKEVSLVVARYNEDIEWVLPYDDIAVVYNKGYNLPINFKKVLQAPNIGREGHTYLYHIINNYGSIIKKTIFVQGGPFEHNETLLFGIDNHEKTLDVQPLGLQYLKNCNIPPSNILEKYKIRTDFGLEYLILNINPDCMTSGKYFFYDKGIDYMKQTYKKKFPLCESPIKNFLTSANFPITKKIDDNIRFTFSALFSVTRDKIIKHDISVYQGLINELTSYHPQGGENGYILERLWLYIFED
jgi:hypothetical protein